MSDGLSAERERIEQLREELEETRATNKAELNASAEERDRARLQAEAERLQADIDYEKAAAALLKRAQEQRENGTVPENKAPTDGASNSWWAGGNSAADDENEGE